MEKVDYRNNNKSQLFTLAEQFYNQRNLEELDKVCDLYLDYFSTIESPQLHKILFYSSFANFDINREKAIQQGELLYDKKDVHKDTRFYTMCNLSQMYTRDPTPIPKIIHLLFFGETNFENFHYECISSMIKHMPDYEIIIHNKTEPGNNPLWDEIAKKVTVEKIEVPEYFDGYKLNYFQYKADVVRLEVIYEKGGIYLDIDMLIIKNFEHLINTGKDLYISEEGKRGGGWINAFIAAKPKNEFLKLCLENFKMGFRMENWAWHMRDGNRILFEEHPHYEIKYNMEILEHKYFFPFSWTEREKFINIADHLNDDVHGIHLYETILHDVLRNNKYFLHTISEDAYYHDFENDRFVNEYITHSKKNGYFIELGAGDGINGSQCYYFEKNLDWDGLCVEPCAKYRKYLSEHRKKPIFKAVSDRNETTTFMESDCTALSGVKTNLLTSPNKDYQWYKYKEYDVELSTLFKLLDDQGAPTEIDFCGMDIENSELPVLAHFFKENKGKYKIKCFAIEANDADQLNQLMLANSYIELKNPYLDMKYIHYEREKRKITWEKYYLHADYIDELDNTTIIKNTDQITPRIYDKILVLTLEEQPERRRYMEKLLHDHRLECHSLLVHRQHKQPLIGCLEAHMNAIKYAKKHNLKSVMIFEDDIIINDCFKTIDTYPDNWDMLYFGGILTDHKLTEGDWIKGTIWCNHAYIVKAALYDKILEIYADLDKEEMARKGQTSDWLYTTFINPHYNCWLYEKQAIIQKEGFSLLDQKQKWVNNFDWSTWRMLNMEVHKQKAHIVAITVSTNFSDLLAPCLINQQFFKKWYIITDKNDQRTVDLIEKNNKDNKITILYHDFQNNGRIFDFGGAIRKGQAIAHNKYPDDLILLLDSDIILPSNFMGEVLKINRKENTLYGCKDRWNYLTYDDYKNNKVISKISIRGETNSNWLVAGYFKLYLSKQILYNASNNCSRCDLEFHHKWEHYKKLNIIVSHLGIDSDWPTGQNHWDGRKLTLE